MKYTHACQTQSTTKTLTRFSTFLRFVRFGHSSHFSHQVKAKDKAKSRLRSVRLGQVMLFIQLALLEFSALLIKLNEKGLQVQVYVRLGEVRLHYVTLGYLVIWHFQVFRFWFGQLRLFIYLSTYLFVYSCTHSLTHSLMQFVCWQNVMFSNETLHPECPHS